MRVLDMLYLHLDTPSLLNPLYWNRPQGLTDQDQYQACVPLSNSGLAEAVKNEV
jgi:hypothetical protein